MQGEGFGAGENNEEGVGRVRVQTSGEGGSWEGRGEVRLDQIGEHSR